MLLELLSLQKSSSVPLYRQLTHQISTLIREGVIKSGYQLPSSRKMASHLGIHRKTVVAAIDQLVIEGWLDTKAGVGTFVSKHLVQKPAGFQTSDSGKRHAPHLSIPSTLQRDLELTKQTYRLDDGLPDPRLAPLAELARTYKAVLGKGNHYARYTYGDTKGHLYLRQVLCEYLKATRALSVSPDQILITRGVTQALFLTIQALLKPGDKVAVGELNWESANANFLHHGIELVKIRVGENGLDVDHLEEVLEKESIQMVYCTPHHQYPTTVIMPAAWRIKLIRLARVHGFYLFEDDYDYDFHYTPQPVMPLASADHGDFVVYAGSFTKAISPVFRVGYLVANENQIDLLARIRRMVDRQGDALMELSIAELLKQGIIQRFLRKNKKIYQQRRDHLAALLLSDLQDVVQFNLPPGGMSIWTHFDSRINLQKLSKEASRKDLFITSGSQVSNNVPNATRLGFASSNEEEIDRCIAILKRVING